MKNDADKKTHDNVMLLAMSTLPRYPKLNTYAKEEGEKTLYFKSFSQMEPHTKYVLYLLAEKREKLDRIVILETEKARTEKPKEWGEEETATTLFEKRIRSYLGEKTAISITLEDELKDLEETCIDSSLYREETDREDLKIPEFITVNLEKTIFFWEAVQKILGNDNHTIHLYMDMQGGDRNTVAQMNAIVELLTRRNVSIEGRFANDYESKRKTPLHKIREASKEYRTYELISAMDIFDRYGWGEKLEQYFDGKFRKPCKERQLIKAIKAASYAISKCNGAGFDSAVAEIERLRDKFDSAEPATELDVVYQDINKNYEKLFAARYRYVQQIRWCMEKNFLQQAFTILEAKMPYEFVHSGLIYYMTESCSEEKKKQFLETCENLYLNLQSGQEYKMKDLNHYLIKEYCVSHETHTFQDPCGLLSFGLEDKEGRDKTIELLDRYRTLCDMRNQMNHAKESGINPDGFFVYMKNKYTKDSNWKNNNRSKNEKKNLEKFLNDWEALANKVPQKVAEQIKDIS